MSQDQLARDFLDTVADLEAAMVRLGARDAQGLGDAARQLAGSHSLVRRYQSDLMAFAGLRNAIAHHRYQGGRPIATPLPETVTKAQGVLAQFERPALAFDLAHKAVMFDQSDALQPSLEQMAAGRLSQAPVTAAGTYRCMLTTNAVARWLAANIDDEGNVLMPHVRVSDVLDHLEEHEVARFVARTLTASEAVDLLTSETPPLALLITQDGKMTQSILRVLVSSDIPALLKALGG